ncbi:cytochrome P450 [Polaribacter sp. Z014]|uniref:cytochrome P450 n=1 Tax=Polaribacter sp. Z014 TaxID=2927126 RepID=UPI00201FD6B8|nr:cytochrome P450 [Polaribacter sp. Z014]MCL7764940.1 cytochrome P450 [Polaribacter sp. Z014]
MKASEFPDAFKDARQKEGVGKMNDQDDPVTMVLRHKEVRKCAHQWQAFQSGGDEVGRIVIPSEVKIRDTRQIPFEVDPPQHKSFRDILDPWFKRPLNEEYSSKTTTIIEEIIDESLKSNEVEVVADFALKLQSRALTLLLNIPYSEANLWISWGTHVFRSDDSDLDADKANILYDYIDKQIDLAIETPSESLYSVLLNSEVDGEKMTKEEVKGVLILTFAGGRDTVINAVTNSIAYFAGNPKALAVLKEKPEMINNAVEELVRYFSPLTQMGRVATKDTHVCEHAIKADTRISLNWASANRDENVFETPNEVVLDRKVNPHVSFGFGTHNCLGATHARQILRILLAKLSQKVTSIAILDSKENIENLGEFNRKVGFDSLNVQFKK